MKRFSILLIVVALIGSMVGCPADGVPEYVLTVSSTDGGAVTTPGEGVFSFLAGTVVDIAAEPETGFRFVKWTGDADVVADIHASETTVTVNEDCTITAHFVAVYLLTIDSTDGGSVIAPGEGVFGYDVGTVVDLVAEIDGSHQFVSWTGQSEAIADVHAPTTTITMNGHCSITARFFEGELIRDWHDLHAVRDNLDGSYLLMNDLDSTTAGYAELAGPMANGGKGWAPLGVPDDGFTGRFDGQDYGISDLLIDRPDESNAGLFGVVDEGGFVENVGLLNANVTGRFQVGGLAGLNGGAVIGCHSGGTVTGESRVGGLVGFCFGGTVSNSYCLSGSVDGATAVGGLVGRILAGTVSNSYYNYHAVLVNGENVISAGALFGEDIDEWLANGRFLDVDERLSQEDGHYLINDVSDFKELLAFGQNSSLRFRLQSDLDLSDEAGFYVPYLSGAFHGDGHRISNLRLNSDSVAQIGLFGYLASGGEVTEVRVENIAVSGYLPVGGLVGHNHGSVSDSCARGSVVGQQQAGGLVGHSYDGSVSNSYSSGDVTGIAIIGGLVGANQGGTVNNSYSTCSVTGQGWSVGGLVGWNSGKVSTSFSVGTVAGDEWAGGLVEVNDGGVVSNSFWDTTTSGRTVSDGGTGKTTVQMRRLATFADTDTPGLDEPWDIVAVAVGETNPAHAWNIVDGQTYPFLSWQRVS